MTDSEILHFLTLKLKDRRIALNLKQTDLSNKSSVPLGTIRAMERTGKISLVHFIKITRALNCLDMFAFFNKQETITDLSIFAAQTKKRQRIKK